MKKILIACVFIGLMCCSSGAVVTESVTDNTAESVTDNTASAVYYVENRPVIAETETEVNTSESIITDVMNELENNFRAAGFDVVRDSANHITIK